MQWALEHPWLTFVLGILIISAAGTTATNIVRYKVMKLTVKESVDKHK
ncbi:hypothetical protein J2Z32_003488 [Paenibacillus turicensis]|uniref:Uncharacterized protein n=1 Tax=Paenibacillus turicensis TaxID=160487 RepID=A0ABS4FWI8_9BACL|nr:hypothetical protein [Paenibacillus turicensis]MBP1906824.1 hypothetical protein [Paenibacillus turicensis]